MKRLMATLALLITLTALAGSQEAAPQRVLISSTQMADQILKKVRPVYPPLARQARIQKDADSSLVIGVSGPDTSDSSYGVNKTSLLQGSNFPVTLS